MSRRPTISAAVITLNEERNLPGLFDCLTWADEIVIVDGGSRDGTVALAERRGCRVSVRPFDNFAAQRNVARELAGGDWVLSIDADERVGARLAEEIRRATALARHDAYHIPIRSTIFGRPVRRGGTQDDQPVRLFRRAAGRWTGDVHETLSVCGRVGRLRQWLDHTTTPDLATFLSKMDRYTSIEASARVAAGRPWRAWQPWLAPPREVFRRLIWKHGALDGPAGWAFCLLSGYTEWVLAGKHRRLWQRSRS